MKLTFTNNYDFDYVHRHRVCLISSINKVLRHIWTEIVWKNFLEYNIICDMIYVRYKGNLKILFLKKVSK